MEKNGNAQSWIQNRHGQFYTIAESGGLLHQLRNELKWSEVEAEAIGRGFFNRLLEYETIDSIC